METKKLVINKDDLDTLEKTGLKMITQDEHKRLRTIKESLSQQSPRRRPPCVLMTASAALHADCDTLKKLGDAGHEIIVVQDADFEASARVLEKVRRETLAAFNETANKPANEPFKEPILTTDQARAAMQLLKQTSISPIIDSDQQRIIDDLMEIIRLVRYSDPKSWKVGNCGGQDSYAGLPHIMRTIDTELLKKGISILETE